jgi:hypothetical protein
VLSSRRREPIAEACLGSDDYVELPTCATWFMQFQEVSLCRSNSIHQTNLISCWSSS